MAQPSLGERRRTRDPSELLDSGVSESAAHWEVANYRDAYGLFACSGILFNHESPLRPERFVTRKIVLSACRIADGKQDKLTLGNLDIQRDWGWAPEYVEAMRLMMQLPEPEDFVIATGQTNSLKTFCKVVFDQLGLDWEKHIVVDKTLYRPSEIMIGMADPSNAKKKLGWEAKINMEEVIKKMIQAENLD